MRSSRSTERFACTRFIFHTHTHSTQGEKGYLAFVQGALYYRSAKTGNSVVQLDTNTLEV